MSAGSSDRRYSEDEMRRILEDAANAEPHAAAAGDGYTLEEIQDIAKQAGIDSHAVARAAASLHATAPAAHRSSRSSAGLLGLPLVLHEERALPRVLTNEEMRRLAQEADRALQRVGNVREGEHWLEWYDERGRAFVGVVRGAASTRIRMIVDKSRELLAGSVIIGTFGVTSFLGAAADEAYGVAAVIAALTYAATHLFWKWRTDEARSRMEDALDTMEEAVSHHRPDRRSAL